MTTTGGLGIGLLENVIEAYNFIVNNYTPGDELFFFGFSRGAYTVRAASGLVSMIGIITPASMRKFLTLYNAYIQAEKFEKDFAHSEDWQKWTALYPDYLVSKPDDITIQVIGVFDTVGAMGVPDMGHTQYTRIDMSRTRKKYEFIDTRLSPRTNPMRLPRSTFTDLFRVQRFGMPTRLLLSTNNVTLSNHVSGP